MEEKTQEKYGVRRSDGEVIKNVVSNTNQPDYLLKELLARKCGGLREDYLTVVLPEAIKDEFYVSKKAYFRDGKFIFDHYDDFEKRIEDRNKLKEKNKNISFPLFTSFMLQDRHPPIYIKIAHKVHDFFYERTKSNKLEIVEHRTDFFDAIHDVLFKIDAMDYHLKRIKELRDLYLSESRKSLQFAPNEYSTGICMNTDKIIFEFESFLFQADACLNIFSRSFRFYLKQESKSTKTLKIKILELLKKPHFSKDKELKAVSDILNRASWLSEFEQNQSKRDKIVHYGKLEIIPFQVCKAGKINKEFIGESSLGKISLIEYSEGILKNTLNLIEDCYIALFNLK
ncbi:MAG: hypothetical protein PHP10_03320 [Candidatus Omnitrophica bacterium]|nr:hypothetical protein [Candidatus Omnitrophota bacterium]